VLGKKARLENFSGTASLLVPQSSQADGGGESRRHSEKKNAKKKGGSKRQNWRLKSLFAPALADKSTDLEAYSQQIAVKILL